MNKFLQGTESAWTKSRQYKNVARKAASERIGEKESEGCGITFTCASGISGYTENLMVAIL